jgi:hypothetical protein
MDGTTGECSREWIFGLAANSGEVIDENPEFCRSPFSPCCGLPSPYNLATE